MVPLPAPPPLTHEQREELAARDNAPTPGESARLHPSDRVDATLSVDAGTDHSSPEPVCNDTAPSVGPATFTDDMTLEQAKTLLRQLVTDGGTRCPTCGRTAKVYRRTLTSVAARTLVALWNRHGFQFAHVPTLAEKVLPEIAHQGGYLVLSAHWGLIEEEKIVRVDGGRAGYWRVTRAGADWIKGRSTVPCAAHVYQGERIGFDRSKYLTIATVLGAEFDLGEALARVDDVEPPSRLFPQIPAAA